MLGLLTPHAWALPKVSALLGFAGLFFGVGVWRFRFKLS